ncbi:MAG: tetratricopeptide repeat protein [Syntrophales bacterium]
MTDDMMTSKDDLLEIGSSAVKNGNYDIAISAFHSFILRDLKCVEANNIRDMIYKYYDNYGEAIKDFDRAIELKPECAAAYYNRACTYRKDVDDIQQAIKNFTKAIELRSGYAEAYNNRGDLYEYVGDYEQAIVDFTKAIELKPDYAMAYVNRGITYARHDNKSQLSIADIKKAISLWQDLVI